MKFTAKRDQLLDAFLAMGSFVSPRPVRPVLTCVLLEVSDDGTCVLSATDLEITLRYRLQVEKVVESGIAALPVARLAAILRESAAEEITITLSEAGKAKISSGRSNFQVLGELADEFPEIPDFLDDRAFSLDRKKLVSLVRKTQFAVAREKSRFAFNGAKLHIQGDEARMIATDGKRLAMKVEEIENTSNVETGHIIPVRALTLIDKVLADDDEVVRIALDDQKIMFATTRAEISSTLVEGSFPDYEAVIPKKSSTQVSFQRDQLVSALRQAALFAPEQTRSVRFEVESGRATVRGQAPDAGQAEVVIDLPEYDGESVGIAFNPDFLVEGLKVMAVEQVTIGLNGSNQAAKISGEENYVYVVMPVTMRKV